MDKIFQNFDTGLDTILQDFLKKPMLIRGIVHLLLVLYAARLAPTPPKAVLRLFDNVYFKLFIFSLVLWTAQFSPATSVLIALAFMVTMNYSSTGKLWEMMDNIGVQSVSSSEAIQAVKILSDAALSPEASSPAVIAPVAQIVASATTTEAGLSAVKALAEQAVTPVSGTIPKVTDAVITAISSITTVDIVPTHNQAVQAVAALANAAASSVSIPPADVIPVAQIASSATTTSNGLVAVQALAEQAVNPHAGTPAQVEAAAQMAVESINQCYPRKQYDMAKVSPQTDGQYSFEDYQGFTASQQ